MMLDRTSVAFFSAIFAVGMSAAVPVAAASQVVVDRGLPTDNLNNAVGGDRSNVTWGFGAGFQSGDTFKLGSTADPSRPEWQIDRITTWFTASNAEPLDTQFTDIALYLGAFSPDASISKVASSTISGNSAVAANVELSKVTYDDGSDYQGSGGGFIQMWQADFTDLGTLSPGDYLFSVAGLPDDKVVFNHASNATLGGVPADGADDRFAYLTGDASGSSLTFGGLVDSDQRGYWDKSSDLNVVVSATAVPLPAAAWLLLGVSGGLIAAKRRQTRHSA